LGFGSNRGDSSEIFRNAIRDLSDVLENITVSSLYRTVPQDYVEQDDFMNLACVGNFTGTARELLEKIHVIENAYGRDRSKEISKGPRTLDIDILLFGNEIISEPDLVVPHERMRFRQFALVPLLDIVPDCADPVTGESYRQICLRLGNQGVQKAGELNEY
jgi:2-amino-4-hydroxy-6-hydroxymethyldihydropteridine diphosphokinase